MSARIVARAPGKLVLSGAYAVLEGAPALVTAVDRYVLADASRLSTFITPEVRAALTPRPEPSPGLELGMVCHLPTRASMRPLKLVHPKPFQFLPKTSENDNDEVPAPFFDASALRDPEDRKLGLGSSAAILVASLAAIELSRDPNLSDEALVERVLETALSAHRRAQRGGSGIDVATVAHGGTRRLTRVGYAINSSKPFTLPEGIHIEVFSTPESASTSAMLRGYHAFERERRHEFRALLTPLRQAAKQAASKHVTPALFFEALAVQAEGLARLGEAAEIPIVTDRMAKLAVLAKSEGAIFMPSGAGGGDVVLYIAFSPSPPAFLEAARRENFHPLPLRLGARGVHATWVDDAGQPL